MSGRAPFEGGGAKDRRTAETLRRINDLYQTQRGKKTIENCHFRNNLSGLSVSDDNDQREISEISTINAKLLYYTQKMSRSKYISLAEFLTLLIRLMLKI